MSTDPVNLGVNIIQENDECNMLPVLTRLLAEGEPVSIERFASEGGWSEEQVGECLSRHPSVEYDEQGRIVGFGITLRPTPHRFDFNGNTVYGWCASDALSFPILLSKPGIVSSTCPITRQKIKVEVTPKAVVQVDPPDAVVSSIRPTDPVQDVRSEICSVGFFFSSREVASEWRAQFPEGFLYSVEKEFEIHRQVLTKLGWAK